jgi:hypothetical protein
MIRSDTHVPVSTRAAIVFLLLLLALVANISTAEATPAWARKYSVSCTFCHSAWPTLNELGREFKLNGYRTPDELTQPDDYNDMIDGFLSLDRSFPFGVRFVMRPFDKKRDQRAKIRSFHEIELMAAGRVGRNMSAWVEMEAEDEGDFNVFVESGVVGFHPTPQANVTMGWAPPFWADPFETLADGGRRMTRGHRGPLDQRFVARERLRSASQHISFYGRTSEERLFYAVGMSSGGDDPEGGDARDGFARVMVKAAPGLFVGGFFLGGTNETQAMDREFQRAGVDVQVEYGNLHLQGLVLNAQDDGLTGINQGTTVGYVEGFYVIPMRAFPMIVPLVRVDALDQFTDLTLQLSVYVLDNVKVYGEWWQNVDTPTGGLKNHRFTVQVDLAL